VAHKLFLFNFFILSFFFATCNSIEPPPKDEPTLALNLEDVSITEARIILKTTNIQLPTTINLEQNDSVTQSINLSNADTVLYVDSLLPNKAYNFKASSIEHQVSSNQLQITTLDTTSQNFTFETYEFGDGGSSSYFNDVWVFDENNIWAVGYISPSDTTINGTHITNPNIIKWDGISWKLQPFSGTSSGIEGIWAQDTSLIYFANGIVVKYQFGNYNYEDFTNISFSNGQAVHKLWGSAGDNIWGVGPQGTIVHFDGQSWKKIEFDTQWHFYQITGDKETGISYAVGLTPFFDCVVVKLENLSASVIYQKSVSEIKISSRTITENNNILYIAGSDIQSTKICRLSDKSGIEILYQLDPTIGVSQSFAYGINDIYYVGPKQNELGLIHFNQQNSSKLCFGVSYFSLSFEER